MKNWLLIANSARARVLEESADAGTYRHVADLVHPESRQKGLALADDRPGHVVGGGQGGVGSSQYRPRTEPRERERDRFAREVAQTLNDGVASGLCAGLTLVASDPFLGEVKGHLSDGARKAILRTVTSDYTHVPDAELPGRLASH